MCKAIEDRMKEVAAEVAAETAAATAKQKTVEFVLSSIKAGLSQEVIAQITHLTVEQVKEIAGQKSA